MSPDVERARSALACLDPNMPRDDWAKVAMAVKAGLGPEGFEVFDAWSQRGDSYNAKDTRDTFTSVNGTGG